mgnify:CR=1 FL=1
MTLVRFNNTLPSLLENFFETDWFDWASRNFSETNTTLPSVNIKEDGNGYEVEVAAPGLNKEDFKIEINDNVLSISSEKKVTNETKEGQRFTRREFSYQSFCRTFTLPNTIETDKIDAKYESGILRISIPKKEEAKPKPVRKIEIK